MLGRFDRVGPSDQWQKEEHLKKGQKHVIFLILVNSSELLQLLKCDRRCCCQGAVIWAGWASSIPSSDWWRLVHEWLQHIDVHQLPALPLYWEMWNQLCNFNDLLKWGGRNPNLFVCVCACVSPAPDYGSVTVMWPSTASGEMRTLIWTAWHHATCTV